jgi:hypothetical protein
MSPHCSTHVQCTIILSSVQLLSQSPDHRLQIYKTSGKLIQTQKNQNNFLPKYLLNSVDRNKFSLKKRLTIRQLKIFLKYINTTSIPVHLSNGILSKEKLYHRSLHWNHQNEETNCQNYYSIITINFNTINFWK